MTTYNRYQKLQKYIDNVPQNEYKQGELIGEVEYETLEECEGRLQYRWVISETKTVCTGYDLYSLEVRQISRDGGVTWRDTNETRTGPLIEKWSKKCGVVTQYRWQATGVFGCNYGLATEQFIYQKSEDMGHTWEDVQPVQYKYETTENFTDECLRELDESATIEFDAGEEGGELTLNIDGGVQIGTWRCDLEYSTRAWWVTYDRYFKVDWGDEVTEHRHTGSLKSAAYIPHYPSKPQVLNHIYRTGGIKTIKIYGPISGMSSEYPFRLVNFKQPYRPSDLVKQFSHTPGSYGGSYRTLRAPNLVNIAMSITNTNSLGKWEDERNLTNFSTLDISASPDFIGTTDEIRASYLNISNCTNLANASNFTAVNTLEIAGCNALTHFPKVVNVNIKQEDLRSLTNLQHLDFEGTLGLFTYAGTSVAPNYNYDVYLTNLTKLETISGTLVPGSGAPTYYKASTFNATFTGLTSLRDVSGLTIKAGNWTFKDCVNITEMPTVVLGSQASSGMFANTGITQVDLSKISGSGNFNDAFRSCPNLTSIVGSLHDLAAGSSFYGCFADNPTLTTVGPIFKNQTSKINIDYLFSNCNITSIDNEFFKYDYTGELMLPIATFANNPNLNSYPIQNSLPIWKWPAFFTGEITYCGTFYGTKLDYPDGWTRMTVLKDTNGQIKYNLDKTTSLSNVAEVIDWGFASDSSAGVSSTLTTVPVGDFLYKDLTSFDGRNKLPSTITHLPEGFFKNTSLVSKASYLGWSLSEEEWLKVISEFQSLTTLNYANAVSEDVYNSYTSIGDIGSNPNLVNLDYAFNNMAMINLDNFNPINIVSMNSTFKGCEFTNIENSFNGLTKLATVGTLPTVTNSIKNSFNGWKFSNITADSIVNSYNGVLDTSGEYVKWGIVNSYNNSKALSTSIKSGVELIRDSFNNISTYVSIPSSVKVIKDSFNNMSTFPAIPISVERIEGRCFENIPETYVASKFANNTNLQTIPSDLFSTNKAITNFNNCFNGCSNLTGSSPVDENGYKLWERAGKEGYPTSISGTNCFASCYKLDDFMYIPVDWGGNGGSNLVFKLHTDSSYITINDFNYYNTTTKPIYVDNMTSYDFYSSTTSSSQKNTISWFPDTKNVTTFTPFPSYYTINHIDIDARSTTSLAGLFYNTYFVGDINVKNTQNVTDFSQSLCNISNLDMSTVNLSSGENFNYAFYDSTLKNADNLNLPKATNVEYAFYDATLIGDTVNISIPLATSLSRTFYNTIINGNVLNISIPQATKLDSTFYNTTISGDTLNISIPQVTDLNFAFYGSKIKNINLQATGNITNLNYAFYNSTLENITGLDLSNVTNIDYAFGYTKLTSVDMYAPALTTAKYTFRNCSNLKNFKFIAPALTSVDSYFLNGVSSFDRVEVDLTSYTGTISYLVKGAPYMLIRNIGLLNKYSLSYSNWGANSEENRQSIIDTLVTYSQDRSDNPCTVTLSSFTKSQISIEEMAQINAKGYTIA